MNEEAKKKVVYFFLGIVVLLAFGAGLEWQFFKAKDFFEVRFVNVWQGDSVMIRSPLGCRVLVDGGPRGFLMRKMRQVVPNLTDELDLVVMSHPHLDHFAGLQEIQHRYRFKNLWMTGIEVSSPEYLDFWSKIEEAQTKGLTEMEYIVGAGKYELCGIGIEVLQPGQSLVGQKIQNLNNSSIVMLVDVAGKKILLTGDAELEQEEALVREYGEYLRGMEIDIFKAGHHGSRTSNSMELLDVVNPKFLVISAGAGNSYKHPNYETLEKARALGIEVLRTDVLPMNEDVVFYF